MEGSNMDIAPGEGSFLSRNYTEISAACAAVVVVLIVRNFCKGDQLRLPPGPRRWPVIGHLQYMRGNTIPLQLLFARLAEKYGPIFRFDMGSIRSVIISSADLAKDILETQDSIFASRPLPRSIAGEVVFGKDLLFEPLGDRFRLLRKIVAIDLMSPKRLHAFKEIRKQEVNRAIERILKEGRHGQPVTLGGIFWEIASNVITRMMFSKAFYGKTVYTPEEEKQSIAYTSSMKGVLGISPAGLGDLLPWLRKFDLDGYERSARNTKKRLVSFLGNEIQEHRQKALADEKAEISDFVDILLRLQNDKANEAHGLSDEVIMALLLDLLVGGTETSNITLLWAIAELVKNPEVMKKLRQELDAVVGKGRLVDESDLDNLPYFRAFVFEASRLHPAVGLSIQHVSTKDTKVGGYDIPPNTAVMVNVYSIHRDPKLWTNPLQFNPSRWFDVDGQLDHKRKQAKHEFLPFSAGRRRCPGMSLAVVLVAFTLAQLVHTCDLSLPAGVEPEDVSLEEKIGGLNAMKHPFEVIVAPRLPQSVYTEGGGTTV